MHLALVPCIQALLMATAHLRIRLRTLRPLAHSIPLLVTERFTQIALALTT
jgi:hypothetical protein